MSLNDDTARSIERGSQPWADAQVTQAVADERERCAKIAERIGLNMPHASERHRVGLFIAKVIRGVR